MDLFNDVIWPLFITALVITAIVCFTKLGWNAAEERRRRSEMSVWTPQERADFIARAAEAQERRNARGGY